MFDDSNNLDLEEDESQWDNDHLKVEFDSDLEHELEPGMCVRKPSSLSETKTEFDP